MANDEPPPPYALEDIDEDDQSRLLLSEERRDMDDASRDLPDGWARCYDSDQKHHYYVDESTMRTIWYHPYDDAQYLSTLPITHPAHPESKQAQGIKKKIEDAKWRKQKGKDSAGETSNAPGEVDSSTDEKKPIGEELKATTSNGESSKGGWFARRRDSYAKGKEDKQRAKAEKEEGYKKQRQAWLDEYARGKMATSLENSSRNNQYPPPDFPITRTGSFSNTPYAYGYGGGYGARGYGGLRDPRTFGGGMGRLGAAVSGAYGIGGGA
ncbi:hypothetical protein IAR50_001585 [Cryptococcus sp. DSM 104548]